MTNGPESAPRRSRRAADVPVDSPGGPRERESQQRARDREALRTYKALAEVPERPVPETAPPTRRQLRLQQQQRAAGSGDRSAEALPAGGQENGTTASASTDVPLRRERRRQSSSTPVGDMQGDTQRDTQEDAQPAASGPAEGTRRSASSDQAPLSRRQSRSASAAVESSGIPAPDAPEAADAPDTAAAHVPDPVQEAPETSADAPDANVDVEGMSVEQALVARQALEGQARNHVAAMEALGAEDPQAVDLELLAQQKALAERAKVLNRRTQAIQKLSQENEQRRPSSGDPTTAHNLAMVTPLEFVSVPGMEHPMMKAPQTSHVPIVTSSTPVADAEATAAGPLPVVPAQRPASVPRRVPAGATDVRHSRILARADALVNAPLEAEEAARPIGARSAFGLDPLDVMTAGLGRIRRLRFAVAGVAGLGTLALIVGVLMIVGGLGG